MHPIVSSKSSLLLLHPILPLLGWRKKKSEFEMLRRNQKEELGKGSREFLPTRGRKLQSHLPLPEPSSLLLHPNTSSSLPNSLNFNFKQTTRMVCDGKTVWLINESPFPSSPTSSKRATDKASLAKMQGAQAKIPCPHYGSHSAHRRKANSRYPMLSFLI